MESWRLPSKQVRRHVNRVLTRHWFRSKYCLPYVCVFCIIFFFVQPINSAHGLRFFVDRTSVQAHVQSRRSDDIKMTRGGGGNGNGGGNGGVIFVPSMYVLVGLGELGRRGGARGRGAICGTNCSFGTRSRNSIADRRKTPRSWIRRHSCQTWCGILDSLPMFLPDPTRKCSSPDRTCR